MDKILKKSEKYNDILSYIKQLFQIYCKHCYLWCLWALEKLITIPLQLDNVRNPGHSIKNYQLPFFALLQTDIIGFHGYSDPTLVP